MLLLQDMFPLLMLLKQRQRKTESNLVYLLSPITSSMLIMISIVMTSFHVFGTPIRCIGDARSRFTSDYINEYCWTTSTFSTMSSNSVPFYPGEGVMGAEVVHHNYYQWMPMVLLCLAGLCVIPHMMWKYSEAGLMNSLVPSNTDSKVDMNILQWEKVVLYSKGVANYFVRNFNSQHHIKYGQYNLLAEVMCFFIILAIIVILQSFLKTFLQYCPLLLLHHLDTPLPISPEERLFPILTKCSLHIFGPSGSTQTEDALCLLPVNMINQKVFVVIWLWLALLLIISVLVIVSSILTAHLPGLRRKVLSKQVGEKSASYMVCSLGDMLKYGDWLVISRLNSHFSPDVAKVILTELKTKLN